MGPEKVEWLIDEVTGLQACLVIHGWRHGRAAGGIRVRSYSDPQAQEADARALASAMARKSRLAEVRCGGAKVVVLDHPGMVREAAMRRLGEWIETWEGALWVGADYGFLPQDRVQVALGTRAIDTDALADALGPATARGVRSAMLATLDDLSGARIGVLGAGNVGLPLIAQLVRDGALVFVHDPEPGAADRAREVGATLVDEGTLLDAPLDLIAPCALGGWLDASVARRLAARRVVGAANGILASPQAGAALHRRGIVFVPDELSNAGAFVYWAACALDGAGPDEAGAVVDRIGARVRQLLDEATARQIAPKALLEEKLRL